MGASRAGGAAAPTRPQEGPERATARSVLVSQGASVVLLPPRGGIVPCAAVILLALSRSLAENNGVKGSATWYDDRSHIRGVIRLTRRLKVVIHLNSLPPSSSGLGYLVLSQGTGVRVPVGVFPTTR